MLLIYLLDGHPKFSARVQELLTASYSRGDQLIMSYVGLGELMAGAAKSPIPTTAIELRKTIDEMGFEYLPFEAGAVEIFSRLRSVHRVKTADAIHLASAGAAGVDLFLTGDKDLLKLHVPGIKFIAGMDTNLL
jgi:predicted nucleic acid-binding protein